MHDKKVILALDEECRGALASASTMITERLMQFAEEEPDNKLRLKALLEVADRIGYHAVQEHKVVTQDVSKTDDALVARLRQLVHNNPDNIKLVPKELLPQLEFKPGVVVDAEFSEVEPVAVDPDADLLGE